MRDLANNIAIKPAIVPAVKTAAADGLVVDTLGFNSVAFAVSTGAIVSAGDFGVKIQESDASGSGFADATAVTSNAPATLAASSAYKLGYTGSKRYVRLQLTTAGGTSIALGATAILGNAGSKPVS